MVVLVGVAEHDADPVVVESSHTDRDVVVFHAGFPATMFVPGFRMSDLAVLPP